MSQLSPLVVFSILILTILPLSCADNTPRQRRFFRMDTVTEVTISAATPLDVKPIWNSIDSLLLSYEKRFSTTGELSEIKLLNNRKYGAMPILPELCDMLSTSLAYGDTLNGGFDITILPLKEIWGFCEQCDIDAPPPTSDIVSATVKYIDYKQVSVNDACDSVFFKSSDTRIDVGGIAKGYALARLETLLKERGIHDFVIAAGGDIIASGQKGDKTSWRVGVRHPRNNSELISIVDLKHKRDVLVTSGDYERFRIIDGKRYHHIFNPADGYSCAQNQSLTIWATDGSTVRADVLSTGLFCKSADEIMEFIDARNDVECLVVDGSGKIYTSAGWDL